MKDTFSIWFKTSNPKMMTDTIYKHIKNNELITFEDEYKIYLEMTMNKPLIQLIINQ